MSQRYVRQGARTAKRRGVTAVVGTVTHGKDIYDAVQAGTYTALVGHRSFVDSGLGRNLTDSDLTATALINTSSNGQTISKVKGALNSINHSNVLVQGSWLTGEAADDLAGMTVSRCEIGPRTGSADTGSGPGYLMGYSNFTLIRCDMHNDTDMVRAGIGVTLTECYLHDFTPRAADPDPHFDGVQTTGGNTIVVQRCYIYLNQSQSGGISLGGEQGATTNWTIRDNYIKTDGAYALDIGGSQVAGPVIVDNCVFDVAAGKAFHPERPGQYRITNCRYANGTTVPNEANF